MSAELLHAIEWDTSDVQRFVGLGLGRDEVNLFYFQANSASGTREFGFDTVDVARCFDYSPHYRNWVGYGINSGSVYIRELKAGGERQMIQLKPEGTRRCNALSFSSSNLVATAYERTKQHNSIYIWDVTAAQEQHNIPAMMLPVQDTVNAVRFVPQSSTSLLFGESKKIVEYDIRSQRPTVSIHTPFSFKIEFTKANPYVFASYGEGNVIALWDRRMIHREPRQSSINEPLLVIPRVFRDQKVDSRCIRFSLSDENELAVLQGNAQIRRWQLSSMPIEKPTQTSQLSTGLNEFNNSGDIILGGQDDNNLSRRYTEESISENTLENIQNSVFSGALQSINGSTRGSNQSSIQGSVQGSVQGSAHGSAQGSAQGSVVGSVVGSMQANSTFGGSMRNIAGSMVSGNGTGSGVSPFTRTNSTLLNSASDGNSHMSGSQAQPKSTQQSENSFSLSRNEIIPTNETNFERSLFVDRVHTVKTETDKVVSFDYSFNIVSGLPEFVCVRQSGTIYRMPIMDPLTSLYIDPFNTFHAVMPPSNMVAVSAQDGLSHEVVMQRDLDRYLSEFKLHASTAKLLAKQKKGAISDTSDDGNNDHNTVENANGSNEESNAGKDSNANGNSEQGGNNGNNENNNSSSSSNNPNSNGNSNVNNDKNTANSSSSGVDQTSKSKLTGLITSETNLLELSDSEEEEEESSVITVDDDVDSDGQLSVDHILRNDISTIMRLRALAGYSLDAQRNILLLTDPNTLPLSQEFRKEISSVTTLGASSIIVAWKWVKLQQDIIRHSGNYLYTPEIDLRYIGVASVWGGLSEESLKYRIIGKSKNDKSVDAAVKYAVQKSPGSAYVSAGGDSYDYRQLALRLIGWDFDLSELESKLLELEAEGKFEKAAGWAVFHNNVERAVESLAKSGKKSLRLMSTAIAGYLVYKDVPANNLWREQCRRLASELSAPYLRAIFAYIADNSWLDVLDDSALPLTERLGIALRFLPKQEVSKYLSMLTSRAIQKGDLEGIILIGFTPRVFDLLQAYLDRSGDIQTICLLAALAWPRFTDNPKYPIWFLEYRQLLNSWQYFSQRARLDIARNKLDSQRPGFKPPITPQVYLRCANCKQNIMWDPPSNDDRSVNNAGSAGRIGWNATGPNEKVDRNARKLWNRCPKCNYQLPSCGVCTNSLGPCMDDEVESDRWPTFCLKCNHAFHSVHAREWFERYDMCPVPTCKCYCSRSVSTAY